MAGLGNSKPQLDGDTNERTSGDNQLTDERIECLKDNLRYYQRLLNQERIRTEALQSLADTTRQERDKLREKMQESNGMSAFHHRNNELNKTPNTSLDNLGQSSVFPNREAMTAVFIENSQLRKKLRISGLDPQGQEKSLVALRALENQLYELRIQNTKLERQVVSAEKALASSPDERLRELAETRIQLEEYEYQAQLQSILTQSLTDEQQALKEKLHASIQACQRLKMHNNWRDEVSESEHNQLNSPTLLERGSSNTQGNTTQERQYQEEIRQLQLEINQLRIDRNKALEEAKYWQESQATREQHISKLKKQLQEVHDKANADSTERQQQEDALIKQYKSKITAMEDDKQQVLDENLHLRREKGRLKEQIEKCESQLADANERIQLLEQQLHFYKDDFEQERQDSERLKARVSELEQFVARANRGPFPAGTVPAARTQLDELAERRVQALRSYEMSYLRLPVPMQSGGPRVVAAGGASMFRPDADGEVERPPLANEDVVGLPVMKSENRDAHDATPKRSKSSQSQGTLFNTLHSQGNLFDRPQSQGKLFDKPQSQGNLFDKPQSQGNVFDKPQSQGNLFDKPQSQGNLFDKPPSQGNLFDKPHSQGNLFDKPQSQGNLFDKPPSKGNLFDKSQSPGNIFEKDKVQGNSFSQSPQSSGDNAQISSAHGSGFESTGKNKFGQSPVASMGKAPETRSSKSSDFKSLELPQTHATVGRPLSEPGRGLASMPLFVEAEEHTEKGSALSPRGAVTEDSLQCPKCQQTFSVEQHLELLDHITWCCD